MLFCFGQTQHVLLYHPFLILSGSYIGSHALGSETRNCRYVKLSSRARPGKSWLLANRTVRELGHTNMLIIPSLYSEHFVHNKFCSTNFIVSILWHGVVQHGRGSSRNSSTKGLMNIKIIRPQWHEVIRIREGFMLCTWLTTIMGQEYMVRMHDWTPSVTVVLDRPKKVRTDRHQ
jgi:hypothetical protein